MENILKKKEIIFFLIIFIIGTIIFKDFGISIDEDNSRINGFVSLNYIFELFQINFNYKIDGITLPKINNFDEQGNGVMFDLPLAFIEYFFNINNFRDQFLLRHFSTFIIFFISLIYFYKLIFYHYKNQYLAFIGVLMIFLSPRIFGESFYNSKDIVFLSLNIISIYYSVIFLDQKSKKNLLLFIIFSSIATGVRIIGLFVPIIVLLVMFLSFFRNKETLKNDFIYFIGILLLLPIFITLFWPYLWSNPINNFISAFNILSNHYRPINNFFLGEYQSSFYVDWYYILVWIGITIPITYIFLFLIGLCKLIIRLKNRLYKLNANIPLNDLYRGNKELKNIIYFLNFFIPLFTVIIFHSTLYTGWRHLYFIYPPIIMISLYGIYSLKFALKKNLKYVYLFIIISFIQNSYWIYKNHPFQYLYFNFFVSGNFDKNFDMDYWGVSNYNTLDTIAKLENKTVSVGLIGDGDLILAHKFLREKNKKKIIFTDNFIEADYLIDNFNRWNGIKKTKNDEIINKNFQVFYEQKIGNIVFSRIYKNTLN